MKLKKRTYNTRLLRLAMSYSVQEIAELFGLHKGAVLRWVKNGLPIIDQKKPYLIHGTELAAYLDSHQKKRKHKCKPDEFFCCKCRAPRRAWENVVDIDIWNKRKLLIRSICAVCDTPVNRLGTVQRLPEYRKIFTIQTIREERITESLAPIVNSDMRKDARHEEIQP